jgi:hypothetical protein
MNQFKQHSNSTRHVRQEEFHASLSRPGPHSWNLSPPDLAAERYIIQHEYVLAVEREGFWSGCWAGCVALDPHGHRVWLGKRLRCAVRRLLERGIFDSLIDLTKQYKRESLDRRILHGGRKQERDYYRSWGRR